MNKSLSVWLMAVCMLLSAIALAQENVVQGGGHGTLIVSIHGFDPAEGQARVYLFKSKEGFPSKPDLALVVRKEKVSGPEMEMVFGNLPYGEYAVAVHHDRNANDKLDHNWMHIPKEPTGASNGARGKFGPPKFSKAKVELASDTLRIDITVR